MPGLVGDLVRTRRARALGLRLVVAVRLVQLHCVEERADRAATGTDRHCRGGLDATLLRSLQVLERILGAGRRFVDREVEVVAGPDPVHCVTDRAELRAPLDDLADLHVGDVAEVVVEVVLAVRAPDRDRLHVALDAAVADLGDGATDCGDDRRADVGEDVGALVLAAAAATLAPVVAECRLARDRKHDRRAAVQEPVELVLRGGEAIGVERDAEPCGLQRRVLVAGVDLVDLREAGLTGSLLRAVNRRDELVLLVLGGEPAERAHEVLLRGLPHRVRITERDLDR